MAKVKIEQETIQALWDNYVQLLVDKEDQYHTIQILKLRLKTAPKS